MAGESLDFATLMQSAYESGDPNALLDLLNSQEAPADNDNLSANGESIERSGNERSRRCFALNPAAAEFQPSTCEKHDTASGQTRSVSDDDECANQVDNDYDQSIVSSLCSLFPHADEGVVHALLVAHAGDVVSAKSSLTELDAINALDGGLSRTDESGNSRFHLDTEAYATAVAKWDSQFPQLQGSTRDAVDSPVSTTPSASFASQSQLYGDDRLLRKAREHRLALLFPWVSLEVISSVLSECAGSLDSAENLLRIRYVKPKNWESEIMRQNKTQQLEKKPLRYISITRNDYAEAEGSRGLSSGNWISTGESVREFYEEMREEAREEARRRNKLFEQAAAAARAGKGAEAARLGAQGRSANMRMKQLHQEAAEMIWQKQNADFIRNGQIDLHALHVSEALDRLPSALSDASQQLSKIKVITGTGHHSVGGGGAARLKPAVASFLKNHQYPFTEIRDSKTKHIGAFLVNLKP